MHTNISMSCTLIEGGGTLFYHVGLLVWRPVYSDREKWYRRVLKCCACTSNNKRAERHH